MNSAMSPVLVMGALVLAALAPAGSAEQPDGASNAVAHHWNVTRLRTGDRPTDDDYYGRGHYDPYDDYYGYAPYYEPSYDPYPYYRRRGPYGGYYGGLPYQRWKQRRHEPRGRIHQPAG